MAPGNSVIRRKVQGQSKTHPAPTITICFVSFERNGNGNTGNSALFAIRRFKGRAFGESTHPAPTITICFVSKPGDLSDDIHDCRLYADCKPTICLIFDGTLTVNQASTTKVK
jgi:hypothetical protein